MATGEGTWPQLPFFNTTLLLDPLKSIDLDLDLKTFGLIDVRLVLVAALQWELCLWGSGLLIDALLWGIQCTVVGALKKQPAMRHKLRTEGPTHIVSTCNAVLCICVNAPLLLRMIHLPGQTQYTKRNADAEWMGAVFLAYLSHDILHILYNFREAPRWDMVAHHIAFICCAASAGYHGLYVLPFTWLTLGEMSTIFLNIRWFLLTSGRKLHAVMALTNAAFAVTFGLTRIVVYSAGIAHMIYSRDVLVRVWHQAPVAVTLLNVLILAGSALNMFWFYKIVAIAKKAKAVHNCEPKDD